MADRIRSILQLAAGSVLLVSVAGVLPLVLIGGAVAAAFPGAPA